jgi:hypothetical protein
MTADFVVLETDNFESFIQKESPADNRPSASWKDLTEVNLVVLWSILLDEEYTEERRQSLKMLYSDDGGAVWLVVFPDSLVTSLSELNEKEMLSVGSVWAEAEEFQWGWAEQDVQELLGDIVRLARIARKESKPLILWGSL